MNTPVIAIVGCGFIGSHLADELPKLAHSQDAFPFKFRFIDFDKWEDRNAANQHVNYRDAVAEEYKAITCARYAEQYPNNSVEAITEKLTVGNANELLKDTILVIDAVDNVPTRQLLWAFGISGRSGPVMHTGISRKGDGIINWSAPNFDTFPFKPQDVAGREFEPQDFKEPPCEMYKYRTSGVILVQAIAKATAFFLGKDPWDMFGGAIEHGSMTVWNTNLSGHKLLLDDIYLKDGFVPTCVRKLEDQD